MSQTRRNWIQAAGQCRLEAVLDDLFVAFEADIRNLNGRIAENPSGGLNYDRSRDDGFDVCTPKWEVPHRVVAVRARGEKTIRLTIQPQLAGPVEEVFISVVWDKDTAERELQMEDRAVEPWQISMRALIGFVAVELDYPDFVSAAGQPE